jgi:hypothetical protein
MVVHSCEVEKGGSGVKTNKVELSDPHSEDRNQDG